MGKDSALYGIPRPKTKPTDKAISTSTSLAFTSQLSSLLASSSSNHPRTSSGRARPSNHKSDIFIAHNKNAKKRAAKDLEDDARDTKRPDIGGVDDAVLHRSKRKMEEKARLYAAMKRGDYVAPNGDETKNLEELGLVDFDRKWAEHEARGDGEAADTSSDDHESGDEEMVEYTDEFGRQRMVSKAEAAREERRKRVLAADEPDRFSARPVQPANLILGDTVQAAAFNPDEPIATKMEELAKNRDRSPTPPEDVHYDASKEVRSKGVGFYSFSKDKRTREQEMEALERERTETETGRVQKQERIEKRKKEVEERRRLIREKRGKKEADRFLDELAGGMGGMEGDEKGEQR